MALGSTITINNIDYIDMTPIMTSNSAPSPYVTASSTQDSSSYAAYKAFNEVVTNSWCSKSNPGASWLSIGNTTSNFKFNTIAIKAPYNYSAANGLNMAFREFVVQGSNDNSTWTNLKEFNVTGSYIKNEYMVFDLCNVYEYKYIRLYDYNTTSRYYVCAAIVKILLKVNTPFFLIDDNGTYKNYDKSTDTLITINDTSILNETAENNTCIGDLNKVKNLIDLSNSNVKLICNQDVQLNVTGLKANTSMAVTLDAISLKKFETIHKITGTYNLSSTSSIKFIFSYDKGLTWKTFDINTGQWNTLTNLSIPIKLYNTFTTADQAAWDAAKAQILTDGVDIQNLGNVDFDLKEQSIMFAVVINRPSYADDATLNDLQILYDGLKTYLGVDRSQCSVSVCGDTVTLTPSFATDSLLLTMVTNT